MYKVHLSIILERGSGSIKRKKEKILNQTVYTVAVLLEITRLHSLVNNKFQLQWIGLDHLHCYYMCKLAPKEATVELPHLGVILYIFSYQNR